ncbi:hypothetical protein EJ110_NYTH50769 [Nymphaea thermarum]|nr:hypothetical protein EJ110_NYTH50769 [Nymphaea thermarum]
MGDWVCPECQFMNFARNTNCRKCKRQRQRQLNPGEWECPSFEHPVIVANWALLVMNLDMKWFCLLCMCDFLNFPRNTSCLKYTERPEGIDFGEQIWKRPYVGTRMVSSRDEDDQEYED